MHIATLNGDSLNKLAVHFCVEDTEIITIKIAIARIFLIEKKALILVFVQIFSSIINNIYIFIINIFLLLYFSVLTICYRKIKSDN